MYRQCESRYLSNIAFDPALLALARRLRQEQTTAESLLWALLRNRQLLGFKFRRQHFISPYVLDFYCSLAHLGIELDGGQHNEPVAQGLDDKRRAFLKTRGIQIVRFWNYEVLQNTEAVLDRLYGILAPPLTPTLSQ